MVPILNSSLDLSI